MEQKSISRREQSLKSETLARCLSKTKGGTGPPFYGQPSVEAPDPLILARPNAAAIKFLHLYEMALLFYM